MKHYKIDFSHLFNKEYCVLYTEVYGAQITGIPKNSNITYWFDLYFNDTYIGSYGSFKEINKIIKKINEDIRTTKYICNI